MSTMRAVLAVLGFLSPAGCAAPGYRYEAGDYFHQTPDEPPEDVDKTWCRPAGFTERVPFAVCQAAIEKTSHVPAAEIDRMRKEASECALRVSRAGFVQTYSGQIYELCAAHGAGPFWVYGSDVP